MKKYNFVINNPLKLDFNRILTENPESDALIVLSSSDKKRAILCLSEKFLAGFFPGDEIKVLEEVLSENWGHGGFGRGLDPGLRWASPADLKPPSHWRTYAFSREKIPTVIEEICVAREFQRRIKVTVLLP